jgi:hypothetical protein
VLAHPAGFKPVAAPWRRHLPMRKAEALIPSGCPPIPLRTGARPGAFTFPWRMAQELNLLRTRAPTARFQRGALPVGQPSAAESGAVEAHTRRCALVSSEARCLIGSLSLRTARGTRTLTVLVLSQAPPANWARAAWSDRPDSNWRYDHGEVAC